MEATCSIYIKNIVFTNLTVSLNAELHTWKSITIAKRWFGVHCQNFNRCENLENYLKQDLESGEQ